MTYYSNHALAQDEYKTSDDSYNKEGSDYETLESLIQCGFLKFCGCGNPEDNLLYILGGLELLAERWPILGLRDKMNHEEWEVIYNSWFAKNDKYYSNEGAKYFFYYWLDTMSFTEHGGSVPGWLTDTGEELLQLLKEYKESL